VERLQRLYQELGQSPWLDNLTREMLVTGELARLRDQGVRGQTSNPTIFEKAIAGGAADYDEQLGDLARGGGSVTDAYWALVVQDISNALDVWAPLHRSSGGRDGFVSLEVSPELAHDTAATMVSAQELWARVNKPNLMVKVPATAEGIPAIRALVAAGVNVNVTLIFSLDRYAAVMEAYLAGLEARPGDLGGIHGVASFFVSRVDTEVDRRLEALRSEEALALRGRAAVAQAVLAYEMFRATFSGPRWEALLERGANVQRILWASTSTKNPAYPDLLYVDSLIGPDSVNTMPDATLAAFADRGTLARTVDADVPSAHETWTALAAAGVDLDDVAAVLEEQGVASFQKSFDSLLETIAGHAAELRAR
jgi:transaldolase